MWRRAYGRLAAIAVVVGGLLSCATATKPIEGGDEHELRQVCGGAHPPLEPDRLARLTEKEALGTCGPMAVSEDRYGEIRVVFRLEGKGNGTPLVKTEGGDDLPDEIHRCVEAAALRAVPPNPYGYGDDYYSFVHGLTVDLVLGTPPPLLPPTPAVIDQWLAATRSKPARERFEAQMPAEVALGDDDCLSIARRPPVTARLERWLAKVGTPVDRFWGTALLWGLRPEGTRVWRAYLLGEEQTMLVHDMDVPDRSRQEVCLVPLDERLRQELQAHFDQGGTCSVGDLREVLLHPRTDCLSGRPVVPYSVPAGPVSGILAGRRPPPPRQKSAG